jgi:hypothetical protein
LGALAPPGPEILKKKKRQKGEEKAKEDEKRKGKTSPNPLVVQCMGTSDNLSMGSLQETQQPKPLTPSFKIYP